MILASPNSHKLLPVDIAQHLKTVAENVSSAIDDNFLQELVKAWNDHKISMLMIRDILMYMVRPLFFFFSRCGALMVVPCVTVTDAVGSRVCRATQSPDGV